MRLAGLATVTRKKEFQYSRQCGTAYFSKNLILQVSKNNNTSNVAHVGFTVSRRVGSAVIRNLVKRRLRNLSEQLLVQQAVNTNYIFIARKYAARATFDSLRKDILVCLNKANLHIDLLK